MICFISVVKQHTYNPIILHGLFLQQYFISSEWRVSFAGWDEILPAEWWRGDLHTSPRPGPGTPPPSQTRHHVWSGQQLLPAEVPGAGHQPRDQPPDLRPGHGLRVGTVRTRLTWLSLQPRGLLHEHLPKHKPSQLICKSYLEISSNSSVV